MSCLIGSSWIMIINDNIYVYIYVRMHIIVLQDHDCFMLMFICT